MVRVALAQINPTVGDIRGNTALVVQAVDEARAAGAQVVALPELVITGYPPEDLVLKRGFVRANREALDHVAAAATDVLAVVGFVDAGAGFLYNAAAICFDGAVEAVYHKQLLPNYGVFDERRYFEPGRDHTLIETPDGVIGVCVCEDAWEPSGPIVSQGDAGAQVVININASPFHKGKLSERSTMLADRARRAKAAIVYVNMVGGQDELVFDGSSLVIGSDGNVLARLPQFEEELAVIDVPPGDVHGSLHSSIRRIKADLTRRKGTAETHIAPELRPEEEIYEALTLGLRDYVRKNGFKKVVIGLSGGIDSALTATLAADALGPENVLGVAMPSDFSTSHSVDDAKQLAANLGIELVQAPIARIYDAYLATMEDVFGESEMSIAEENVQARIRGNLLMAISNRYGHLVLATGNKSEMAVGYATLYGDMAGGFALLKDVFKTEVYALARRRNERDRAIPENIIAKAPSAELRPDQKDEDSLPAYDVLDPILEAYIEKDLGLSEIVEKGHERDTVERIARMVDMAEYKRRQAPPGPKVTIKAFGRDRRLPITNRSWEEGARGLPARSVGERRPGVQ